VAKHFVCVNLRAQLGATAIRECKVVVVLKLTLTLRFHPQQHYQDSFVA